jgi:hypothetical protein
MPLNGGEFFAGFRIIRLLGSGAWVRSTWPGIPGSRVTTR